MSRQKQAQGIQTPRALFIHVVAWQNNFHDQAGLQDGPDSFCRLFENQDSVIFIAVCIIFAARLFSCGENIGSARFICAAQSGEAAQAGRLAFPYAFRHTRGLFQP